MTAPEEIQAMSGPSRPDIVDGRVDRSTAEWCGTCNPSLRKDAGQRQSAVNELKNRITVLRSRADRIHERANGLENLMNSLPKGFSEPSSENEAEATLWRLIVSSKAEW